MSRRANKGFSMIEMLVVIGIISMLAGILLTAVHSVRVTARKTRARNEVDQISAAWLQYQQDYRRFPRTVTLDHMNQQAVTILRGSPAHADNPRSIVYLDFNTNTIQMVDPWNEPYYVELDTDYNNKIAAGRSPTGQELPLSVAVWSRGPDKQPNTEDDIRSWRKE